MGDKADILLVEDSPDDVEMLLYVLVCEAHKRTVEVARDGAEALEYLYGRGCGRTRASSAAPVLVVLDLKLPRVSGLAVLQRIKSDPELRCMPVVVLTSSSEDSDVAQSYSLGANSYVVKPVDFEKYAAAVRAINHYWLSLNERRPRAA